MRENKLLWLLAVAAVVLLGIFAWLMIRLNKPADTTTVKTEAVVSSLSAPYFPANTEYYLDKEETLQVKSFQPIYKELVEVDQNNRYLIVSYVASEGGILEEGKVFLGRQIPYVNGAGIKTSIESVKLKEELKTGERFGIYYLATVPADFSMKIPYCQDQATRPVGCLLAYLKRESDKKGEKIFYPLVVYQIHKR